MDILVYRLKRINIKVFTLIMMPIEGGLWVQRFLHEMKMKLNYIVKPLPEIICWTAPLALKELRLIFMEEMKKNSQVI